MTKRYLTYWGKAKGNEYHLLAYHLLDVEAVAEVLLQHHSLPSNCIPLATPSERNRYFSLLRVMTCLHDLGKFSESFQNLKPELHKSLSGGPHLRNINHEHHTNLGITAGNKYLFEFFLKKLMVDRDNFEDIMQPSFGHHGKPCDFVDGAGFFYEGDRLAQQEFTKDWLELRGLEILNEEWSNEEFDKINLLSWVTAGFIQLCDWLGSNRDYFPFQAEPEALTTYWVKTLTKAERCFEDSGLTTKKIESKSFHDLWPGWEPTPLQKAVDLSKRDDGPELMILEDLTGNGKTEAALLAAMRLIGTGKANGFYFGLPTQATSNAMFERIREFLGKIAPPGQKLGLSLAHGNRERNPNFKELLGSFHLSDKKQQGSDIIAELSPWIADSLKKSLLAQFGVGTLDQALLGVFKVRHNCLRLFGLLGKVLIVDEVHAYDDYMRKGLQGLLEFQGAMGGSAVLLSATLPASLKEELIKSFYQYQSNSPSLEFSEKEPFPLASFVSRTGIEKVPCEAGHWPVEKEVRLVHSDVEAMRILMDEAGQGRCGLWIRNTVKDALDAYHNLLEQGWDPEKIHLFHSRFCLKDRLDIETMVTSRFGKQSGEKERRGQILIATQVVEQSLDLDFDCMISDLCPMDLIIQRAGRLHRHYRDDQGNPIHERDQRPSPVLHVLSPPLKPISGDWYNNFLPGASYVYPDHGRLYLTAELLENKKVLRLPKDSRELIEGVYGSSIQIPEELQNVHAKAEGKNKEKASLGDLSRINLSGGYAGLTGDLLLEEGSIGSRSGDGPGSQTVYLGKCGGPLYGKGVEGWFDSRITIPGNWVKEFSGQDYKGEKGPGNLPGRGKWSYWIELEPKDDGFVPAEDKNNEQTPLLFYHPRTGLERKPSSKEMP